MNWIRENKFLTGFIAVLVIGAGALGYLLYSAWGDYSDVTDQYNQTATELRSLQAEDPYPSHENLTKYRSEEDDLIDATHSLAASLSQMVLPVEDLTPSGFQDRLRDTLSTLKAKAAQSGVKLPDNFSMDFDQYQTQPPPAGAAGPLGRQLTALDLVVNILIDEHIESLTALTRTRLPQESGGAGAGGAHGFGQHGGGFGGEGGRGGGGGGGGGNLVNKIPFEIRFIANQAAFQKVLNDLAASSKQFFITRTLIVDNTNPKPVSKADAGANAGGPGAGPAGSSAATGGTGNYLTFIVGTEKLDVGMRIDIVDFNPPGKSARNSH